MPAPETEHDSSLSTDASPDERFAVLEEQLATQRELIKQLMREKNANAAHERVFNGSGIQVVTGTSNPDLARLIGQELDQAVDDKAVTVFVDRSPKVRFNNNVRNQDVFIVQPTSPPDINQAAMELLLMIDAAKRASAGSITAVIPYDGFGRSDKKDESRVPIGAALMAILVKAAGANRILGMDPHAGQSQGFFDGPMDILYGNSVLLPAVERAIHGDYVAVAADAGAGKMAQRITHISERATAVGGIYKTRPKANQSKVTGFMGDVRGRTSLIIDELIDTFGSIDNAARKLKEEGARDIFVMATHALFSEDPAQGVFPLELLTASPIEQVFITDTVAHRQEVVNHPKITVVSAAPLLAEGIRRIHSSGSLSELILK